MAVTIRESTEQERTDKWPAIVVQGKMIDIPKYVVVNVNTNRIVHSFFLPQGGETQEEAVFWAERFAGKNGVDYQPPAGWEFIEGKLPEEDS